MVTYAVILIVLAVLLFVLEIFVPSGGIIGFLAVLCLVGGLVCLFWVNTTAGLIASLIALAAAPFAFALALKIFPNTPIGRGMTLLHSQSTGTTNYDRNLAGHEHELIGATGFAITGLRPVGTCKINGKRIECLAENGMIEPGAKVRVASVQDTQVKVRPA